MIVHIAQFGTTQALHAAGEWIIIHLCVRFGSVQGVIHVLGILILARGTEAVGSLCVLAAVEPGRSVLGTRWVKVDELADGIVCWDTGVLAPLDIVVAYGTL